MTPPGRLITIEGIDGAGKTTLARALADALDARGLAVTLLREPGGVAAAERVRELVKDPELHIGARAEALLYAAARAQLVEEALAPLLGCRPVGPARPLRRLLAGLPGRRARARHRRRARDQRVRHRRPAPGPHAVAGARSGGGAGALARPGRAGRPARARAG